MITRQAEILTRSRKMTLLDVLDRYVDAVACSERYVESLRRTVRKAQASGLLEIRQLVPDAVNSFLSGLDLSPVTIGNIRRELLTLWRWAFEEGLTDTYPHRIRKVRAPLPPPVCWSMDELRRLYDCAKADATPISGRVDARRCDLMPAWIAIAYDTGMRFGDIHTLRCSQVKRGFVTVIASKTGKPLVRQLSPLAIKEAASLVTTSPDGSLFLWALPRRRALRVWRSFLDEHGFDGSSKWLRRCAATMVELRERGAATAFLQHSAAHLATKHYIDQTQLACPVSPPPITGTDPWSRTRSPGRNHRASADGEAFETPPPSASDTPPALR